MISISKRVRKKEINTWERVFNMNNNFLCIELTEAIAPLLVVMDIRQLAVDSLIDSIESTLKV